MASVNDLKTDIITEVTQLSDALVLERIRTLVFKETSYKDENQSFENIPKVEMRKKSNFQQLIKEQKYKKITFEEFTKPMENDKWEVSLDSLLSNAK